MTGLKLLLYKSHITSSLQQLLVLRHTRWRWTHHIYGKRLLFSVTPHDAVNRVVLR